MKNTGLFLLLITTVITQTLYAQEWQNYTAISTSTELCNNKVYSVTIDSKGNKWFGAEDGISALRDNTWVSHDIKSSFIAGYRAYATDVAVDAAGDVWITSNQGRAIGKFDGRRWNTFSENLALPARGFAVEIDTDDTKWFATEKGVAKFDNTRWTVYSTKEGLVNEEVQAIAIDGNGNKWFGTHGGISKFDGTTWTNYTTADGLVNNKVNSITIDDGGKIWLGTDGGVSVFDGATWTTYTTAQGLVNNIVNTIAIDADNNKWMGTPTGVSKFDGVTWTTYTTADGLVDNTVKGIAADGEGNLWFATWGGVSRYDGAIWTSFISTGQANGLAGAAIAAVIDQAGAKWFGTWGGLSKFDDVQWTKYTTADGLADNRVNAIAIDAAGTKWIGTHHGVSEFDGTHWTNYTTANGLVNDTVYGVAIDAAGNKWFGTAGGVSKFNGTSWATYTQADGLAGNQVMCVAIDAKGNKWFGTAGNGVSRFNGTHWSTYTKDITGLYSKGVSVIAIDSKDNVFIGAWSGGVSKYNGTSWARITSEGSQVSDFSIGIDASDNVWVANLFVLRVYVGKARPSYQAPEILSSAGWLGPLIFDDAGNLWYGAYKGVYKIEFCPQRPEPPVITAVGDKLESSSTLESLWYFNNNKIQGLRQPAIAPWRIGRYYSVAVLNGCVSEKSNAIDVGFENIGATVVPNPTPGTLHITLDKPLDTDFEVDVYNSAGAYVTSQKQKKSVVDFEVDLGMLQPDLYFIRIHNNSSSITVKAVKK